MTGARVLLVSHDASRTGAPKVALLVARALGQEGHRVSILSSRPGPLVDELAGVAPTRVEPFYRVRRRLWLHRLLAPLALVVDTALATWSILLRRPQLVYINSTSAAVYIRPALWLGCRVVLHAHESGVVADGFVRRVGASGLLPRVSLVACSPSVQAELCRLTGRSPDEVVLVPSVPDLAEVFEKAGASLVPYPDRDPDAVVVGACGSVEHRKGIDLWLRARAGVPLTVSGRPVSFVWVGSLTDPPAVLPPGVSLLGPTANPYPHLARFDVMTLPSRDDPFPLVVLEAMALGTPVVAFDVGGVADQVGPAGVLIAPGDVTAFAAAVSELVHDAARRTALGDAAAERVRTVWSAETFREQVRDVVESGLRPVRSRPGPSATEASRSRARRCPDPFTSPGAVAEQDPVTGTLVVAHDVRDAHEA